MTYYSDNSSKSRPRRGTVLILCIALLVILGTLASTFVLLTLYQRSSSRSLSRADDFEQVRQMSLAYVRTLLLKDIVGDNGVFLDNDADDEPYDSPGSADPWLASHEYYGPVDGETWPYISNVLIGGVPDGSVKASDLKDDTDPEGADTDGDGIYDARWVSDANLPFANVKASDGTKYRVAIRIVDTNALANINVGQVYTDDPAVEKLWDSQYPAFFNLRGLIAADPASYLDNDDGTAPVPGRYNQSFTDPFEDLYFNLYRYLANPNPPASVNYIRPFDVAEEIALRAQTGPGPNSGTNLHSRFGSLWPTTFYKFLGGLPSGWPWLFTAYSWTMQIRPPCSNSAVESELSALGFPAPCKVRLDKMFDSDPAVAENARRAVYLALVAALLDSGMDLPNSGMNAATFLVNLLDYIDADDFSDALPDISVIDWSANSAIDFAGWATAPANPGPGHVAYGTDCQPIISEVYSYRYYDWTEVPPGSGIYTFVLNENKSRYAVELYNPTNVAINLSGWSLKVDTTNIYDLSGTISAGRFWILSSHSDDHLGNGIPDPKLVIGPPGPPTPFTIGTGNHLVTLTRQGPGGASDPVVVDRCEKDYGGLPTYDGDPSEVMLTDLQRPGNDYDGDLIPVVAEFQSMTESDITLGSYPTAAALNNAGNGGHFVFLRTADGQLHSLGELLYVPRNAYNGTAAVLIMEMEDQPDGDSDYRFAPSSAAARAILQYITLRTGLKDGADNDGDGNTDVAFDVDGKLIPSSILEARVPGLININTAPSNVLAALHAYTEAAGIIWTQRLAGNSFNSLAQFAQYVASSGQSYDEGDPATPGVGSPDGITVDNEQKLFHFTNVANLISVRSDVFVVYITIEAYRDGGATIGQPLRTMAILDRSLCLRPYQSGLPAAERLKNIPLPRIVAQTTLP